MYGRSVTACMSIFAEVGGNFIWLYALYISVYVILPERSLSIASNTYWSCGFIYHGVTYQPCKLEMQYGCE